MACVCECVYHHHHHHHHHQQQRRHFTLFRYAAPLLQRVLDSMAPRAGPPLKPRRPRAVVVVPTRELAAQTTAVFERMLRELEVAESGVRWRLRLVCDVLAALLCVACVGCVHHLCVCSDGPRRPSVSQVVGQAWITVLVCALRPSVGPLIPFVPSFLSFFARESTPTSCNGLGSDRSRKCCGASSSKRKSHDGLPLAVDAAHSSRSSTLAQAQA